MQHWIDTHPGAVAAISPVYFITLWCFVIFIVSYVGGWSSIAKRFRATVPFTGQTWRFQSGQMRFMMNYGNCLTLGADDKGLYLAVLIIFRVKHPPLFIPWDQIEFSKTRKWIFGEIVRLTLGREERISLSIRPGLAEKLRQAAREHWPVETLG